MNLKNYITLLLLSTLFFGLSTCYADQVEYCSLKSKDVDLTQIYGQRLLIYPAIIRINYAVGYCSQIEESSSSPFYNWLVGLFVTSAQPVCVPADFEPIDIIYVDANNQPTEISLHVNPTKAICAFSQQI